MRPQGEAFVRERLSHRPQAIVQRGAARASRLRSNGGFARGDVGRLWFADVGGDTLVRATVNASAACEFELCIADAGVRASAYAAADFVV